MTLPNSTGRLADEAAEYAWIYQDAQKTLSKLSPVAQTALRTFATDGRFDALHGAVKKALIMRGVVAFDLYDSPTITELGHDVLELLEEQS